MKLLLCLFLVSFCLSCDEQSTKDTNSNQQPQQDQSTDIALSDQSIDQQVVDAQIDMEVHTPWTPPKVENLSPLADLNPDENIVEYEITAKISLVQLDQTRPFELWTYNDLVPGPLLQAKVGDRVIIHFKNELPQPTTIHWHGLRIPAEMDGNPRIQNPVQPGETFTYDFIVPDEGTFWYHPHFNTNEQVEKGLYGAFLVHDPKERDLFDLERVMLLDDLLLDQFENIAPLYSSFPERMRGRYGNRLLINGRLDETKGTATRKNAVERWRLINPANARIMFVHFSEHLEVTVIGTDGGRIEPYRVDTLELGVGTRYDLMVKHLEAGENHLAIGIPYLDEQNNIQEDMIPVFKIQAMPSDQPAREVLLPPAPTRPIREATESFNIELSAVEDPETQVRFLINDESHRQEPLFSYPQGTVVKLKIKNLIGPPHPFHLHGQFFEILSPSPSAQQNQPGLKDSVLIYGLEEVEIIAYLDNPGKWMAHCHVLEHSELGMMSEIEVTPVTP